MHSASKLGGTDAQLAATLSQTHSSSAARQASATRVTDVRAVKASATTLTDKLGAQ